MASSVIVTWGFGEKTPVQVTPMMLLSQIVETACGKCKKRVDPSKCGLKMGKAVLDLTLSVRFANLPRNCKLELVIPPAAILPSTTPEATPAEPATTPSAAEVPVASSNTTQTLQASVVPDQHATEPGPAPDSSAAAPPRSALRSAPAATLPDDVDMEEPSVPASDLAVEPAAPLVPEAAEPLAAAPQRLPAPAATASSVAAPSVAALTGVEAEVGRRLRVILPRAAEEQAGPEELPEEDDDFYSFTAEDLARVQAGKRKAVQQKESKGAMKTQAMRRKEIVQAANAIGHALIRIRFTDDVELEALFHPLDKMSAVHDLVKKCIHVVPFSLFITPPKQDLPSSSTSLYELGLAPAAILRVSPKDNSEAGRVVVRSEVLALAATCPTSLIPDAATSSSSEQERGKSTSTSSEAQEPSLNAANRKKPEAKGKPKWMKM